MDEKNQGQTGSSSILDAIMGSQTQTNLSTFEPARIMSHILTSLKDRDREIVTKRFGLDGLEIETLESIGQKYNLTRERVRQIEKDSISLLKHKKIKELSEALQLIFDTIVEHGNVMSEEMLIQTVLVNGASNRDIAAVRFLLNLSGEIKPVRETATHVASWSVLGFSAEKLSQVIDELVKILKAHGKVMPQEELFEKLKTTEYFTHHSFELNDKVVKSYVDIAKNIQTNPFFEIGLKEWSEVKPRDVGDKAFLVLKHHGKPEHYSQITKLINERKFDDRTAYQETVHNELIKDSRFVLIGRGIYALTEWGYKKGVVADVIREVMQAANRPLSREEIIAEVLKRRFVKRNTILVGLSNKKYFQKVGKDKYALAAPVQN
jgi:hypothetical protein